jgi:hypothetical protein
MDPDPEGLKQVDPVDPDPDSDPDPQHCLFQCRSATVPRSISCMSMVASSMSWSWPVVVFASSSATFIQSWKKPGFLNKKKPAQWVFLVF